MQQTEKIKSLKNELENLQQQHAHEMHKIEVAHSKKVMSMQSKVSETAKRLSELQEKTEFDTSAKNLEESQTIKIYKNQATALRKKLKQSQKNINELQHNLQQVTAISKRRARTLTETCGAKEDLQDPLIEYKRTEEEEDISKLYDQIDENDIIKLKHYLCLFAAHQIYYLWRPDLNLPKPFYVWNNVDILDVYAQALLYAPIDGLRYYFRTDAYLTKIAVEKLLRRLSTAPMRFSTVITDTASPIESITNIDELIQFAPTLIQQMSDLADIGTKNVFVQAYATMANFVNPTEPNPLTAMYSKIEQTLSQISITCQQAINSETRPPTGWDQIPLIIVNDTTKRLQKRLCKLLLNPNKAQAKQLGIDLNFYIFQVETLFLRTNNNKYPTLQDKLTEKLRKLLINRMLSKPDYFEIKMDGVSVTKHHLLYTEMLHQLFSEMHPMFGEIVPHEVAAYVGKTDFDEIEAIEVFEAVMTQAGDNWSEYDSNWFAEIQQNSQAAYVLVVSNLRDFLKNFLSQEKPIILESNNTYTLHNKLQINKEKLDYLKNKFQTIYRHMPVGQQIMWMELIILSNPTLFGLLVNKNFQWVAVNKQFFEDAAVEEKPIKATTTIL